MPSSRSSKTQVRPGGAAPLRQAAPVTGSSLTDTGTNVSSCPERGKLTKWRKFVLVVHIDRLHLLAQKCHCRFCRIAIC